MSDDKENNVIQFKRKTKRPNKTPGEELLDFAKSLPSTDEPPKKERESTKRRASQSITGNSNAQIGDGKEVSQSIRGNRNIQISGSGHSIKINTDNKETPQAAPLPAHSIGNNSALRIRIENLIKDIISYRYKRYGKNYKGGAVYGQLATAFGLRKWNEILLWDESRAPEVISWLESKRNNTQQGKIEKAATRSGYQHSRGHLHALEKKYLTQTGWGEPEYRSRLALVTGREKRRDLSDNELRNWISYIERYLDRFYDETDN